MTRTERWAFVPLVALTFFVGVTAFLGGVTLLAQPSGTVFRMPVSLLDATPFESFAVPGLLLMSLGVLHLLATWAALTRRPSAWLLGAAAGVGLVVWTTVQLGMIGYVNFLQPVYAALGVGIVAAAVAYAVVEHGEARPLRMAGAG